MTTDPPSRSAEVLERLARDEHGPGPVGALWERVVQALGRSTGAPALDPQGLDRPGGADGGRSLPAVGGTGGVLSGRFRTVLAVAAVVVVVAVVVLERRPAPIEQRLPMTAGTTIEGEGTGGGARSTADGSTESAERGTGRGAGEGEGPTAGDRGDAGSGGAEQSGEIVVHVAGAVARPGVVRLAASSRAVDAVAAAGGLRPDADPDRVNLAAGLTDGQRVVVPVLGQPAPQEVPPSPGPSASSGTADRTGSAEPVDLVDLNTADAGRLEELPGIGPATAAAILAHREDNGPFPSVDSLIDVRGIGEAKLEALRDLVTVGPGG